MNLQARGINGNGGSQGGFLNAVRSISDIGKTFSHGRNLGKVSEESEGAKEESTKEQKDTKGQNLELPKVGCI